MRTLVLIATLVAWVGSVLFALMLAGPFVLIVTLVVALAAAAAVVTLAGAILATPFVLIRHVHLRLAQRRFSEGRAPIAIAMLRESMTARTAR